MKRIWICLLALGMTACGQAAPARENLALGEAAAAACQEITADLTFTASVEAADGTVTAVDITPETAWNVRGISCVFPVSYTWYDAAPGEWEAQIAASDRGQLLTFTGRDGRTLQCCSGGDVVCWTADGTASYARAVNPKEGQDPYEGKLYTLLRSVPEDGLRSAMFSGTVDGGETDWNAVAASLADQAAAYVRSLPDWVSWKPADIRPAGTSLSDRYRGQPEQLCCGLGFRLQLGEAGAERLPRSAWEAGAGLTEPDAAGVYGWGVEALVVKNEAGDWICRTYGTGGLAVQLPFGQPEDAALAELTDAFFLTEGESHDWRLPEAILSRSKADLADLADLLAARTEPERREFCSALAARYALYAREDGTVPDTWISGGDLQGALGPFAPLLHV